MSRLSIFTSQHKTLGHKVSMSRYSALCYQGRPLLYRGPKLFFLGPIINIYI